MKQLVRIFILQLGWLFSSFCFGQNIGDVFTVKAGTDAGGCDAYANNLNQIWDDCRSMNQRAIQLLQQALGQLNGQDSLRPGELVFSYFGVLINSDLEQILSWYNDLQTFIDGGGIAVRPGTNKPHLFCHSTWLARQAWTAAALGANGQPLQDANGNAISIQSIPEYQAYRGNSRVPFWSADLNEYFFGPASDGATFCNQAGNLGATQNQTQVSTMSLCPLSFQVPNDVSKFAALNQAQIQEGLSLSEYTISAMTLYHELVHLVRGDYGTPDNGYELLGVQQLVDAVTTATTTAAQNSAILNSRSNPESYAFMALAAWYWYETNFFFEAGVSRTVSST